MDDWTSTNEWKLLGAYLARSVELDAKAKAARDNQTALGSGVRASTDDSWRKYLREHIEKTYPSAQRVRDLKTLNEILKRWIELRDTEIAVYRHYLLTGGHLPPE